MAPSAVVENGSGPDKLRMPAKREFKGGDLLAQTLLHLGVEVAFGIHGGHLDAFLMGANDFGLRLVDTRHEAAAVQAAEGYHKVKGEVGVCFVTANSGFSNGLSGLATAFADRSSIFCITSSSPQVDSETNVLQGFHDQVVVSKPLTRFTHRISNVEEIPRVVSLAFRIATASPPGPVLIDFPIEVLFSPVQINRIAWGSTFAPRSYPPGPHPEAIEKAAQMIKDSKRPAIVTGTGGRLLKNEPAFVSFVEASQIPVFNTNKYSSPLPFDHPLRSGTASALPALPKIGSQPPDLVIFLGARMGMFTGSRSSPAVPLSDCKYIQVDLDSGEIGRLLPIDLGITSDVRPAAAALNFALKDSGYKAPAEWVKATTSLKGLEHPQEKEPLEMDPGRMHPYHALKEAFSALPAGCILSIDGGEAGSWSSQVNSMARPSSVIFSCGYLGMLGTGWGYCLGAAIADPSRLVVNIQGDGSAGLHLTELDTYARFGCKILTIVCNNHCWGMSTNGQDLIYGEFTKARPAANLNPAMDFSVVAQGLGCLSEKVNKVGDVAAAVKRLTESNKPALLEMIISHQPTHPGTIAMVGNAKDENVVVIPYYDNIPRPRYD